MDMKEREKEKENVGLPRNANIRISREFPTDMGFAVLGSTLFIFGGFMSNTSFSYSLAPHLGKSEPIEPCDIKLRDCKPISAHKHQKLCCKSVLIGAKICVFSKALREDAKDFELYDPDSDGWSLVPNPPLKFDKEEVKVISCFVDGLRFFISTRLGSFAIDFGREDWIWERIADFPKMSACCFQPVLKDGDSLISPYMRVYADAFVKPSGEEEEEGESFFHLRQKKDDYLRTSTDILRLPKVGKERLRACIVDGGCHIFARGHFRKPSVRVSLVRFDDDAKLLPSHLSDVAFFRLEDSYDELALHLSAFAI